MGDWIDLDPTDDLADAMASIMGPMIVAVVLCVLGLLILTGRVLGQNPALRLPIGGLALVAGVAMLMGWVTW